MADARGKSYALDRGAKWAVAPAGRAPYPDGRKLARRARRFLKGHRKRMVMSGTHTRAALPTTYNGVNYRSLLEARYAAWFELVGVEAHYEPEAFAGYIPDFMVHPRHGHAAVIEIKGVAQDFDITKIRRSGWGVGARCATCSVDPIDAAGMALTSARRVRGEAPLDGRECCPECARAYGNVWLLDGRGPRYAKHYWRKHGAHEWCIYPHPACLLTTLSSASGEVFGLLCTEMLCDQIGEKALRLVHDATPHRDPSKRLSYEEDRKLWLGLGGRMIDAAWREAGNRVQWRGRGCK